MKGFILAGGRSTRMGRDKALLPFQGKPLVEHAVALVQAAGLEPCIVGNRPDLARYAPVIEDSYLHCGPLGGMEAALAAADRELSVFIPVDLPLLPAVFLRYLVERAAITGAAATVPTLAGQPEPLCAVYSQRLLEGFRAGLESQTYKVMRVIQQSVDQAEIDIFSVEAVAATRSDWPLDPPLHRWFQNLNTPADVALVI